MKYQQSKNLLRRAKEVVPNGVFGHHRSYAFAGSVFESIPRDYPHFVRRAEGCHFEDVDGNEYIDYLCGYGPMIVGYGNKRVEAAVAREQAKGLCHTFPSELYPELARLLVEGHAGLDWAAFAMNGTDTIQLALLVARAETGRTLVGAADNAFHGNQAWCSRGHGRAGADLGLTRFVPWGDADALGRMLSDEPVAAVVLCPYEQLVGAPNRLPEGDYWYDVRRHCSSHGTVLIIDDIRSGFRLHPEGTCAHFGIDADLVCVSKAIANGHPAAAVLGKDTLRDAAEGIFMSGTFWGYAPALAAALETQAILRESDATAHLASMGNRLTKGLSLRAADRGFTLSISGPDAMPMVLFDDDAKYVLVSAFAEALANLGSFIHPTHSWFLSLAHQQDDIDRTLDHAEVALDQLAKAQ